YVNVQTDGKLKLYDTRANALAGGTTGVKDLTGGGTGTAHKLVDQADSFGAQATSGAGGGKTGVAGSLAINVALTDSEAKLGYTDAAHTVHAPTVTISGGGDVSISAASDVFNTASALPKDGGADGSKTGVGISVAFAYGDNTTLALIGDNTQLTGAHNLTLSASSAQGMVSEAKSGAKGSTAVTPVVAISISDNETDATVGTDSHANLISITGNFSASAVLTSAVETTAEGDTQSDDTGVGISIAVTVVNDNSLATTGRDLHADGTMGFSASTISSSDSSAKASVAGAPGDNGSGASSDGSGKSVDGKTTEQLSYADGKSKEKNSSAKGTE